MTGLLASKGIKVSENNVGKALQTVQPEYHLSRCTATACLLNPVPYHADYFGHSYMWIKMKNLSCMVSLILGQLMASVEK